MPENVLNKDNVKSFLTICSLISSSKPALITRASRIEGSVLEFALRKRSAHGSSSHLDMIQKNLGQCIKRLANNAGILIKNNLNLKKIDGMNFNILKDEWNVSKDLSVNYIAEFKKN